MKLSLSFQYYEVLTRIKKITLCQLFLTMVCSSMAFSKAVEEQNIFNNGISIEAKNTELKKNSGEISTTPQSEDKPAFEVSGKIVDEKREPIPGVNILEKGTNHGTASDVNGQFKLLVGESSVLIFSYIGYITQEITVNNKSTINITLQLDVRKLSEIVVVGYGEQKKTSLTAAVSSVKGEELVKSPVSNITNSLAGRLSGVTMRSNGGKPGADNPNIYIRGISSTGNTAPLIVVDGVIRDNINQIDPNSIESVTVLKDAAAVAPYGMGGANGVLLITTKKGKSGAPVLSFNTYYGSQSPTVYPKMLNATDYMTLRNKAYLNDKPDGTDLPFTQATIDGYNENHRTDPDLYPNSNFYRDAVNLKVPMQNTNLELSGGSDKIRYYMGLGYFNQGGMFENVNYKRYNYNLKIESQATNTTKITMSLYGTVENTKSTVADPIWAAVKFLPTAPIKFSNGLWGESAGFSPIGSIKAGYRKTNANTLLSSLSIEQQLPFIKGLSLKGVFSYDPNQRTTKTWQLPTTYYQLNTSTTPHTYDKKFLGTPQTNLYEDYSQSQNFTYQGYINYHNTFGNHDITGLLVAESRQGNWKQFGASSRNFAIQIDELSMGSPDTDNFGLYGGSSTSSQVGYIYRLGYSYASKYLLEIAGRYDGHYAFAPGKRFGYFPSVSVGWRLSEEAFIKNNFRWIDNLKVRGSWGKSGNLPYINGQLAPNEYLNGYQLYGNAYAFGNGNLVQGSFVPKEANPNITWEVAEKTNIGLEAKVLRGLINVEFDYFQEKRSNMLIPPTKTVPVEYGLNLPLENAGIMKNRGIEITLGTSHKLSNGLQIGLNGNLTYFKNEIVQTFENNSTFNNPNRKQTGRRLGTQFGYHALGLFTTTDDKNGDGLINAADGDEYAVTQFGDLRPGDVRYADLAGAPDAEGKPTGPDGKIDANDQTVIGYPGYPSLTYGFTPTASWGGFDLSLLFQGAAQASIGIANFQTQPFRVNNSNADYEYFNNYWTPEHQDAKYPRITSTPTSNNTQWSDFWLVNTGYLRLKNITFGYTIPSNITRRAKMQTVRVYFSGQNLATFSRLKFMDPEEANVDPGNTYPYPNQKVYTLGLNVSF